MDKQEIQEKVLSLISEVSGDEITVEELDIELFAEDVFDSIGAVEFLAMLDDEVGVCIYPTEIEREEMNTPHKIIEIVNARMNEE